MIVTVMAAGWFDRRWENKSAERKLENDGVCWLNKCAAQKLLIKERREMAENEQVK